MTRLVPKDPPPINRRIYDGLKACVIGALKLPLHVLANLRVPAIFASLPTLFLMFARDQTFGWYLSTASGVGALVTMFLTFMLICTPIYLAYRVLVWITR